MEDRLKKIEDRIACIEDDIIRIKDINNNNWYQSEFKDSSFEKDKKQKIENLKIDLMYRNSIKQGGNYVGLNNEQADRIIEILKYHKII